MLCRSCRRILPAFIALLAFVRPDLANIALFVGLLSIGVTHGSFDLVPSSETGSHPSPLLSRLGFYILSIAVFSFGFYLFPASTFAIFILLSAYHFGKTEFETSSQKNSNRISLCWGLIVLGLLVINHYHQALHEVDRLIFSLSSVNSFENVKINSVFINLINLLLFLILAALSFRRKPRWSLATAGTSLLTATLLFIILKEFSLWVSGGLFFVFWHSVDAMTNEMASWSKAYRPFLMSLIFVAIPVAGLTFFFRHQFESYSGQGLRELAKLACAVAATHAVFPFFRLELGSPLLLNAPLQSSEASD